MKKRKKKRLPKAAEAVQRTGAALAATTKGRARRFTDRKKQAARDACRKNNDDQ
jgi:hypothetical protein